MIGLSLAWELRKRAVRVLVVERGELGAEASTAAGGMLAWCDPHLPAAARGLASLSASRYSEFVREIEDSSGITVDLRRFGTIVVDEAPPASFAPECRRLSPAELAALEPELIAAVSTGYPFTHYQWWPEWSVDPQRLMASLIAACQVAGVEIVTGMAVAEIAEASGRTLGVRCDHREFHAENVVNCAGAWAGKIACEHFLPPTRPVKGQMLALQADCLSHVVRSQDVYLIPRSDAQIVIGATAEEAGFDKTIHADAIERLRCAAVALVPALANAPIRKAWAGLRPGSPDGVPILGRTCLPGYFVATGHFRDGILLAPGTAHVMDRLLNGEDCPEFAGLTPERFLVTGSSKN